MEGGQKDVLNWECKHYKNTMYVTKNKHFISRDSSPCKSDMTLIHCSPIFQSFRPSYVLHLTSTDNPKKDEKEKILFFN